MSGLIVGPDGTEVREKSQEEIDKKAAAIASRKAREIQRQKAERDDRLLKSDWTQSVADNVLTQEQIKAWKDYRAKLRKMFDDPNNIVWPTPPS